MTFAETLTPEVRKRARMYAYGSTLAGCISEVMLDSSAIIILLFTMMKASSMLIMLTSSLSGFFMLLLMIPCAMLSDRIGLKHSVRYACLVGSSGYLLMAAAPLLPESLGIPAAFTGCALYASQRALYGAAWYPLIDNFLRPEDRGIFFSVMRTSYMIFNGVFFFLVGLLMGENPPMWFMQSVIAFGGVMLLLRWVCLEQCPVDPSRKTGTYDVRKALHTSLTNAPLTGYSIYLCILSLFCKPLLPLALLYLRRDVELAPGTVQILSSVGMGGCIIGYFLYGILTRHVRLKWLELAIHLLFAALAFGFFAIDRSVPGFTWIMGILIFLLSVGNAFFLCNSSMEFLALARPGNKTMAVAFAQTYQNAGVMLGNVGTSLILGGSILTAGWTSGGQTFSIYQSIFLILGAIGVMSLILIPIMPSFVPKHEDYYEPGVK